MKIIPEIRAAVHHGLLRVLYLGFALFFLAAGLGALWLLHYLQQHGLCS